jgi:hypothetical protein
MRDVSQDSESSMGKEPQVRIIEWRSGDAPNERAILKVTPTGAGLESYRYCAIWEPGYCGCRDCHPIQGFGATPEEAIGDYFEQWEEKYG